MNFSGRLYPIEMYPQYQAITARPLGLAARGQRVIFGGFLPRQKFSLGVGAPDWGL